MTDDRLSGSATDRQGPTDVRFALTTGRKADIPQGRVAVFSSDTRYNQNVIKHGTGVDLLVHEVASARPELMKEAYVQRIIGHHTVPRDAGRVFAQTRPKLAAYTHIVQVASERIPPPTIDDIVAKRDRPTTGRWWLGKI